MEDNKIQGNSEWLKTYNLSLEDRVECDAKSCKNEATLWFTTNCCGVVHIACQSCYDVTLSALKVYILTGTPARCINCSMRWDPNKWLNGPHPL
jgi:hypothetical protein